MRFFILALICSIVVAMPTVQAQWIQTNGPFGGNVQAIAFWNGSMGFAGLYGGLYRTTDGGRSWTSSSAGITELNINAIGFRGTNAFVGTGGRGLFRSEDSGRSWSSVNTLGKNYSVAAITTIEPYAFAGGSDGVFRSTDDGRTWQSMSEGLVGGQVSSLTKNVNTLFAGTFHNGVYRSTDAGVSWTSMGIGLTNLEVHALIYKKRLFAGTRAGVFISTDDGSSWTSAGIDGNLPIIALGYVNDDVYASTEDGRLMRTTDAGVSWNDVATQLPNKVVRAISSRGSELFVGTYGGGLYRKPHPSADWIISNEGLTAASVLSLATNGSHWWAGTEGAGLFLSTTKGDTWTQTDATLRSISGDAMYVYDIMELDGKLLAATGAGIYRSTNDGGSWARAYTGPSGTQCFSFEVANGKWYAATDTYGVVVSSDMGETWVETNAGMDARSILALHVYEGDMFAGTSGSGVFRSTDGGGSWTPASSGLSNQVITGFGSCGAYLYAIGWTGPVFRSSDHGVSWTQVSDPLIPLFLMSPGAMVSAGSDLFVAHFGRVHYSPDCGESWFDVSQGLIGEFNNAIALDDSLLIVGNSATGVWKRPLKEMLGTVAVEADNLPSSQSSTCTPSQSLFINAAPNPFDKSTSITFSTTIDGHVNVKVYNVVGQFVESLASHDMLSGEQHIIWNADDITDGMYFIHIQTSYGSQVLSVLRNSHH